MRERKVELSTSEIEDSTVVSKTFVPLSLDSVSSNIIWTIRIEHAKHGRQFGIVEIIADSIRDTERATHRLSSLCNAILFKGGKRET